MTYCDYADGVPDKPGTAKFIAQDRLSGLQVLCDPTVESGQTWIVIQRRVDGETSFDRNMDDYKNGFGDFKEDFWFGLDKISQVLSKGVWQMRFEFKDRHGKAFFSVYDNVQVDERDGYKLTLGAAKAKSDGLYDSFRKNDQWKYEGAPFVTRDSQLTDIRPTCARVFGGGWWYLYDSCAEENLNGSFRTRYMHWFKRNHLTYSEIKIRKVA
ncbi:tenascin-R [Elysia marginata]|uniref:Tenascin-R n=1 Tax=Elysia marginata TaxID=1093978 RepID=A0AAV4JMJ1_9GAST|nr:tenascin-R [Elysia marginata]